MNKQGVLRIVGLLGWVLALGACGMMPGQSEYDPVSPSQALEVPPDLDSPNTAGALRVPNATYSRVSGGPVQSTPNSSSAAAQPAETGTRLVWEGGIRSLVVEDAEESAWRRVGFALERIGLSVEDRERERGAFKVEYVDVRAKENRPGAFSRWVLRKKGPVDHSGTYEVRLRAQGESVYINLYDDAGSPAGEVITEEILGALLDRLT